MANNNLFLKINLGRRRLDCDLDANCLMQSIVYINGFHQAPRIKLYSPGRRATTFIEFEKMDVIQISDALQNSGLFTDFSNEKIDSIGAVILIEPADIKAYSIKLSTGSDSSHFSNIISVKFNPRIFDADMAIDIGNRFKDIWDGDSASVYTLGDCTVDDEGYVSDPAENVIWSIGRSG